MYRFQLNSKRVILIGLGLFFGLTSCQSENNKLNTLIVATEEISNEQIATVIPIMSRVSTDPISQTVTSTSIASSSSISSPTPQTTPTLLPTETIPPTPWPTLSTDEAADKVLSFLANNQNPDCLLPCWWGATPGQTNWQDIEPFLQSLAKEIHYSTSPASYGAEVILPLPASVAVLNSSEYRAFYGWTESGVIHGIVVDSMNIAGYDPSTIMSLYGTPDEVWLRTIDEPRQGVLPFQLILVYQQQGISLRYYIDAVRNGEFVTACFEPGVVEEERPDLFPAGPRIYLWEPGITKTIQEISPIPEENYRTLESQTDLTLQALYEKFTDPNQLPCIDTPADMWKF